MHSFLFVGHHKSQPTQDYSRTSNSTNRDDFLKRTEQERMKREKNRQQLFAAIKIQSFYRKVRAQRLLTQLARERVSRLIQELQSNSFNEEHLIQLANLVQFGFQPKKDSNLMMSLIECSWKHRQVISERLAQGQGPLKIAMAKVLKYIVRSLAYFESIRLPTRFLEWFTDPKSYSQENTSSSNVQILITYFLRHIIRHGYYTQMCAIITAKVPTSVSKESRIPAIDPILELVARPVEFQLLDSTVRDEAIIVLRKEFFSRSDIPAIPLLITPALIRRPNFPVVRYIELIDFDSNFADNSINYQNWKLYQLHAVLLMVDQRLDQLPKSLAKRIVAIIRYFLHGAIPSDSFFERQTDDDDDDQMDAQSGGKDEPENDLINDCLEILNKRTISHYLLEPVHQSGQVFNDSDHDYLTNLAMIAHHLLFYRRESILESNFLMSLSASPNFVHQLWFVCQTAKYETDYREHSLLTHLSYASSFLKDSDLERIESLLVTFCSLYSISLVPLHDDDFFRGPPATAFRTDEISDMVRILCDVCLGIVRFIYPDKHSSYNTSSATTDHDRHGESSANLARAQKSTDAIRQRASKFAFAFKLIVQLLQQIRSRDVRRQFCPPDWWLKRQLPIYLDKTNISPFARALSDPSLLTPEQYFNRDRGPDDVQFSVTELRLSAILQQIPFVIPFDTRVHLLNLLIQENKGEQQRGAEFLQNDSTIHVRIRRNFFYQDAFERLSPVNEPNLRRRFRVHFVNSAGLDEAGVDGGGLFREFMNELLKSAFNPNRGLFKLTSDGYLYPNPHVAMIEENFGPHYYFLGRMLGKAIYEKFLSELPFATFFLQKILSRSSGKVDIDHLASLDPELYKNLLYLKNYSGNVEDLGLDFTTVISEIGQTQIVELKPNGRNLSVTNENRIEYIHLVANYKLNKQIHEQVMNFRQGLGDVINLEWLRMFDANELRILISGAPGEIDVSDWRNHCQYREPYNKEHPIIHNFWRCVHDFTDEQKRKLLKFTTSCSRPPLFGFKELYPEFCIQSGGSEIDRLPTSNTCINLLKLPEYPNETMLKEKLLYAIQAAAGFEFS